MKKSGPDYFNMNPLRGSSPTASLAADLSQNFHIDQRFVIYQFFVLGWQPHKDVGTKHADPIISPKLATPRRSLFSSNVLGQANGHGMDS